MTLNENNQMVNILMRHPTESMLNSYFIMLLNVFDSEETPSPDEWWYKGHQGYNCPALTQF